MGTYNAGAIKKMIDISLYQYYLLNGLTLVILLGSYYISKEPNRKVPVFVIMIIMCLFAWPVVLWFIWITAMRSEDAKKDDSPTG